MAITVRKRIDAQAKSRLSDFYSDVGTEYMRYESRETKFRDDDPIQRVKYIGGDMLCPIHEHYSMPHIRLEPLAYQLYIINQNKSRSRFMELLNKEGGIILLAAEYGIDIGKKAETELIAANVNDECLTIEFEGLSIPRGWAARKHIRIDE
ncbi:hypothetical protein LJ721_004726 [Salmonella enterica]|nr:hypothetical protein [Salmonella enterica]